MSARSKAMMKEQKWWQERWCRVGSASKMPPTKASTRATVDGDSLRPWPNRTLLAPCMSGWHSMAYRSKLAREAMGTFILYVQPL
jgi:hypothetical protein